MQWPRADKALGTDALADRLDELLGMVAGNTVRAQRPWPPSSRCPTGRTLCAAVVTN